MLCRVLLAAVVLWCVAAQPPGDELFCPSGCCLLFNARHARLEGRPSMHYRCVTRQRPIVTCGPPIGVHATEIEFMRAQGKTQDVCDETRHTSALFIGKLFSI